LGGKFAGLVLVSLPTDSAPALEAELKDLSSSGLSVQVTSTGESAAPSGGRDIAFSVIGPDRLGIVREISHALAKRHINVLEMDSQVNSAPMSAESIFTARISAWIPETTDMDDLTGTLDEIADHMTLEIDLD
jgi:glycine cleavage system regulatory protein